MQKILRYGVNISVVWIGKLKIHLAWFIAAFTLLRQSGIESAISLRYGCLNQKNTCSGVSQRRYPKGQYKYANKLTIICLQEMKNKIIVTYYYAQT